MVTLRDRHTRLGKPKAPRGALFLAAAFLVVVVFTVIGLVLMEFPRHPAETPRVRGIRPSLGSLLLPNRSGSTSMRRRC